MMMSAIACGLGLMAQAPANAPAPQVPDTIVGVTLVQPVTAEVGVVLSNQMQVQQEALVNGWEVTQVVADQNGALVDVQFVPVGNNLNIIYLGLNDDILFRRSSAALSPKADEVLSHLAANLQNFPQTNVTIIGYASHTGNANDNLDLSQSRAQNVMDYLVTKGVDPTRMKTIAKGWSDPVASNATAAGRAQNRRVEIWITPNQQMIDAAQK